MEKDLFKQFILAKISRMNRSLTPQIAVFVRVVNLGTFAAVAEETGHTSSGVSRMISRLENRLGAKLLHRSTRRLTLTPEGERFLSHAHEILATVEAAEADIARSLGRPGGHLRVNCGTAFAHHKLSRLLPLWLKHYPEVSVDISVSDQRIDPIAGQTDVTIRVGPLANSDLIAVPLGQVSRIIAASPDYLAAHGTPRQANDLLDHNCLLLSGFPNQARWPFFEKGRRIEIAVKGRVTCDAAETLLHAALAGAGIIRLGDFLGADALASGDLVALLDDRHDADPQPLSALVAPGRQSIPRVRAFIDFLKSHL